MRKGSAGTRPTASKKIQLVPDETPLPPIVGVTETKKATFYTFMYRCEDCGMSLRVVDVAYEQKICGRCNRKLTVSKVAQ